MQDMSVDQIWKEEGGVLNWMVDNSGSEYGYGGSSWGFSKMVGWVKRLAGANKAREGAVGGVA